MNDLKGKTFLVTGANAGIGRATAEALAARGGSVVLASRARDKTLPVLESIRRAHPGAEVEFLELDLADLRAVKRAAEQFLQSGRPLDVLINNAGLAGKGGLTKDGFELTLGTNHLGHYLLTDLLLPKLKEAPQGRVVNVASRANQRVRSLDLSWFTRRATTTKDVLRMYGYSKLMNVLHAKELARRLQDTRVTTYALHPGVVASDIWRQVPWPLRVLMKRFMVTNEEGARTTLYCATAPELASVSGRYYSNEREARPNRLADDLELARALFERSDALIRQVLG